MTYISPNKFSFRLLECTTLIAFLYSIYPWPTWHWDFRLVWILALLVFSYNYMHNRGWFDTIKGRKLMPVLLFFFIAWMQRNTFLGFIYGIGLWWCVIILLLLKPTYQFTLIRFITKWTAILIGISMFFFLLHQVGISLPHSNIQFSDNESYAESFNNYYAFIQLEDRLRFQGFFLEPGHMTLALAPLLFLNEYNLKNRYVLLLFAAQIMSFSLAGYIAMFFGFSWILATSSTRQNKMVYFVITIMMFLILIYVINTLFGDSVFQSLILDRLQFEGGQLAGYNRTNVKFDSLYFSFLNSDDFLWGVQSVDMDDLFFGHGNAGYRLFLYMKGFISLVLCVFCFIYPIVYSLQKIPIVGFCILLLLLLAQDAYPLWWVFLISLTAGTGYIEYNHSKKSIDNEIAI